MKLKEKPIVSSKQCALALCLCLLTALTAMPRVLRAESTSQGAITVSWTFATNNMDGTPLTDLAGVKVYYGTSSSNYTHVIDVPGGAAGQTQSFTVSNLVEGAIYHLNGTAYNTAGLESDFCAEVAKVASVPADESALHVSAGPDAVVMFPEPHWLQGTVTQGVLAPRATVSILWTKISGLGTVTFANPNDAQTTASFGVSGTYVLELTATDGDTGKSDRITITVRTPPRPPSGLRSPW